MYVVYETMLSLYVKIKKDVKNYSNEWVKVRSFFWDTVHYRIGKFLAFVCFL